MKKIFYLFFMVLLSLMLYACDKKEVQLEFKQHEFSLKSGERVELKEDFKNTTFEFVNNNNTNIKIDANTGVITFTTDILNYQQLLVVAKNGDEVSEPCVVTLYYDYGSSVVSFTNKSDYIMNNEYVNAVSSMNYSVRYYLKEVVSGISINEDSGKVSFAPIVANGTKFTVVADSHNSKCEKEFTFINDGLVEAVVDKQALSKTEKTIPAVYPLDFSKSDLTAEDGIVTVLNSFNEPIDEKYYDFDKENSQLVIQPDIVDEFSYGSNILKIVTERNIVTVELCVVTKFIYTASDLASIAESQESLSGYYILMNDIDLTEYLSEDGEGYNDGKGWNPIGSYVDTLDTNVATKDAFKGTFDGNGHVITGLYASRKDVNSFNAGLFGYITSTATIKNLGVTGSLNVSSYSGGFVGYNGGVIENCWADVDIEVYTGEGAYRYVGGFVGNNFGTVKNCYSIGNVISDREFGRFAGSNTGLITNCYSYINEDCQTFVGAGYQPEESQLFASLEEMMSYDYSTVLDANEWNVVATELPQLKYILKDFNVRNIELVLPSKTIYAGESLQLDCLISPYDLKDKYIDDVIYTVEGDGVFLINGTIITDLSATDFIVTATLTANKVIYQSSMSVSVKTKITSLIFESDITEVEVGNSYKLSAEYLPLDADENISYVLSGKYNGVTIDGDILTIDPEYTLTDSISLYAISDSGVKSNTIKLNIVKHKLVPSGAVVVYENDTNNLEYTFDEGVNLDNLKVYLFGKEIDYTLDGNKVIIDKNLINNLRDFKVRFLFKLGTDTYAADAYYLSHEKYTVEDLASDVIYINSVEDYFKYFNANPNDEWSKEKLNNYDKTFVLTANLDFGGMTIYGIGTSDVKFSGKFYGMGHTISNFKINQNERVGLGESNSSFYCVGLFASVSTGEIYDVNVANCVVKGKNFAGALVGMITDGVVENCHGYNLNVTASDYKYSSDDVYVGKIVGRTYDAKILITYCDNMAFNTVG